MSRAAASGVGGQRRRRRGRQDGGDPRAEQPIGLVSGGSQVEGLNIERLDDERSVRGRSGGSMGSRGARLGAFAAPRSMRTLGVALAGAGPRRGPGRRHLGVALAGAGPRRGPGRRHLGVARCRCWAATSRCARNGISSRFRRRMARAIPGLLAGCRRGRLRGRHFLRRQFEALLDLRAEPGARPGQRQECSQAKGRPGRGGRARRPLARCLGDRISEEHDDAQDRETPSAHAAEFYRSGGPVGSLRERSGPPGVV